MFPIFSLARPVPARPNRIGLYLGIAFAALLLTAAAGASAQTNPTHVMDASALHPPAGARVAIVEFMDMECPVCATTNPILEAAVAKYKIPLIQHDFLIPYHAWSPIAAVNARWFDMKSKALGEEYRDQVFANQPTFYNNPDLLRQFTEKFAQSRGIALPFAMDPQGSLAGAVKADNELGKRTGIDHTPTIFIVTAGGRGATYVEVQKPNQQLYRAIDQALEDTKAAPPRTK